MRYNELEGMDIDEARKKLGKEWILRSKTTGVLTGKPRAIYEFSNNTHVKLVLFVVSNKVNSVLLTEY